MKGKHTGLSGAEYAYESTNVIPGRAPDTMWLAVGHDNPPGHSLVALVGFTPHVDRFARRAKRLTGNAIVYSRLDMEGIPREMSVSVLLAGLWPDDRARAVVMEINPGGCNGFPYWAKAYAKLVKDPTRVGPAVPDEALAKELAELFIQQCGEATDRGRS